MNKILNFIEKIRSLYIIYWIQNIGLAKKFKIVSLGIFFLFLRCPCIAQIFHFVQLGILGFYFFHGWYQNMINSCNGTSIKTTLLCGNVLEMILIFVFLVLHDAGTFLQILCYGFNFINEIKLKKGSEIFWSLLCILVCLGASNDIFHPFLSFPGHLSLS